MASEIKKGKKLSSSILGFSLKFFSSFPVNLVKYSFFPVVIGLASQMTYGQQKAEKDSTQHRKKEGIISIADGKEIEIIQMVQLWDVYSLKTKSVEENRPGNDIMIRRGRLGARAKIRKDISTTVVFAYDGIGRYKNTPGHGSPNPDDNHDFFLWEAFGMWTYKPMLNVTAGYFRPQVGRENITAAFTVISFEKALTNFQPRTHLIARNTGRELGVNVGGLYQGKKWSFNYNAGIFDPSNAKIIGAGSKRPPLLAGRVAFTLGEAEHTNYKIQYAQSYYGQRKGITLAVNASHQGNTEVFQQNNFYGVDILANKGPWDFIAEYDWLYRKAPTDSMGFAPATIDQVYSIKAGYNFLLAKGKIIQATLSYSGQIADNYGGQEGNNPLTGAARQKVVDTGINYLINKDKLKLNLHYVQGESSNKPSSKRFSYVAAGLQFML